MDPHEQQAALAQERAERHYEMARVVHDSDMDSLLHALLAIEARLEEQAWRLKQIYEDISAK